ncbi:hypothetical protein OHB14_36660 [Streptomyces sp. NBC_01613]|uniref:hypothetical protein n=1 Tax=Streptomyces sp. NBC_01613 TaxID=2975896 RepID=UPI0038692AD3
MRTQTLPAVALRAVARIEDALAAPERERIAKVGQALGFRRNWKPNTHLGETATHITAWTQHELNTVFERVGGTVTTRQVERSTSDGEATWTATEITLTAEIPGVGYVEVITDWDEESGGRDLPLMQAIPDAELIAA